MDDARVQHIEEVLAGVRRDVASAMDRVEAALGDNEYLAGLCASHRRREEATQEQLAALNTIDAYLRRAAAAPDTTSRGRRLVEYERKGLRRRVAAINRG